MIVPDEADEVVFGPLEPLSKSERSTCVSFCNRTRASYWKENVVLKLMKEKSLFLPFNRQITEPSAPEM